MNIVGYYKHPIFGCAPGYGEVEYAVSPYYNIREVYLPTIKKTITQIYVTSFFGMNGFAWINVRPGMLVEKEM